MRGLLLAFLLLAAPAMAQPISAKYGPGDCPFNSSSCLSKSTGSTTARSNASRFAQVINILDYGATTASNDNAAALNAALTRHNATGLPIYIPTGTFKVASALTETLPSATDSLVILGDGPDVSVLNFTASGNGLTITYAGPYNSVTLQNFTITTSTNGTGDGITLTQGLVTVSNPGNSALSSLTNIVCRGQDGYAVSNYWTTCVKVNSVSNINFNNSMFIGPASAAAGSIGVNLTGTTTAIGVVYNFLGVTANYLDKGIVYGTYAQGVAVGGGSNFVGGNYGIYWPAGTGTAQLAVTGSQFNTNTAGIYANSAVDIVIQGNLFYANSTSRGIWLISTAGAVVTGNTFNRPSNPGGTGIQLELEVISGSITGNFFYQMNLAIWYPSSGTYKTRISNNSYSGNSNNSQVGAGAKVLLDVPELFSWLPTCGSTIQGASAWVVDSTTAVWGATITGSGANPVLAVCDATNWTVGAK
jgi:hypothetical protein